MKNDFQKMTDGIMELRRKYDKIEPKKWEVEQIFMGLVKDIGDLSKILMVKNGFRNDIDKDVKKSLEHELVDVLISIIWIANKTGVDLEKGFWVTLDEIENKIKKSNETINS